MADLLIDADPDASLDPSPGRFRVFAIVSVALFMSSVDQTIVATGLPTLQQDLHTRLVWASWTITIYSLGQIVMMPLAGSLAEHFGRKQIFLAAILVFTSASLLCGIAPNVEALLALRAVQALGGGAIIPSATAIIAAEFGRDRDRAIGFFTSIFPIGGVVGPILGGILITYWSWRGIFLINVPIGIVLVLLAMSEIPNVAATRVRAIDFAGVGCFSVGLLALMVALAGLGAGSGTVLSPEVIIGTSVGGVAIAMFIRHIRRTSAPFVPARLLWGRGFGVVNLVNFLFGITALGFGALVPLYAERRFGIAPLGAGTLLTARGVGTIAVAGLAVMALRRTGHRLPMVVGFVVIACGLILSAVGPYAVDAYVWLSVTSGLIGLGMGVCIPASNNAGFQLAPESASSIAGLRGMFRQAGSIAGVSVVSAIIARSSDATGAQSDAFIGLAGVLIAMLPLVALVPDHRGQW